MPSIGSWDTTGLIAAWLPICYKNTGGSNPAAFNTGNLSPLYRGEAAGGSEVGVLTNMGSGYGYTTDGVVLHDNSNDNVVVSNATIALTNASTHTFSISAYITAIAAGKYAFLIGGYASDTTELSCAVVNSSGTYRMYFFIGITGSYYGGSSVIDNPTGAWHTYTFIKNGATLKIYLDNVDKTVSLTDYSGGNNNMPLKYIGGGRLYATDQWLNGYWRWATIYNGVRSSANLTADHTNAATFYGLIGVNDAPGTDTAFDSLTAPGSWPLLSARNELYNTMNTGLR